MISQQPSDYYRSRQAYLLADFDKAVMEWRPVVGERYGDTFATTVLSDASIRFATLIAEIPYIGGDENHLTHALVESVEILDFFRAMEAAWKTPLETGKVVVRCRPASSSPQRLSRPNSISLPTI